MGVVGWVLTLVRLLCGVILVDYGVVFSFPAGPDFKTLVSPLVKHVRLHMIDAQDMMQV